MTKKSNIVPQVHDKNCQSIMNVKPKNDGLNSQSRVRKCSDKKCKENMQPVKLDVLLKKPAMKLSNKKWIGLASDKNCQATMCEYDDFQMCSDKDYQKIVV